MRRHCKCCKRCTLQLQHPVLMHPSVARNLPLRGGSLQRVQRRRCWEIEAPSLHVAFATQRWRRKLERRGRKRFPGYLRNRVNGNDAMVGNVCVKRFLGLRSDLIFDGIKRVQEDPDKALNQAAIDFFWHRNVISPWERDFLESTGARRVLSGRQLQFRRDINAKVLRAFRRINVAMAKEQVGE